LHQLETKAAANLEVRVNPSNESHKEKEKEKDEKKAGESGDKKPKIILKVEKRFQQNAQHDASVGAGREGVNRKAADKSHAKPRHDASAGVKRKSADMEDGQETKAQCDSAATAVTKKRKLQQADDTVATQANPKAPATKPQAPVAASKKRKAPAADETAAEERPPKRQQTQLYQKLKYEKIKSYTENERDHHAAKTAGLATDTQMSKTPTAQAAKKAHQAPQKNAVDSKKGKAPDVSERQAKAQKIEGESKKRKASEEENDSDSQGKRQKKDADNKKAGAQSQSSRPSTKALPSSWLDLESESEDDLPWNPNPPKPTRKPAVGPKKADGKDTKDTKDTKSSKKGKHFAVAEDGSDVPRSDHADDAKRRYFDDVHSDSDKENMHREKKGKGSSKNTTTSTKTKRPATFTDTTNVANNEITRTQRATEDRRARAHDTGRSRRDTSRTTMPANSTRRDTARSNGAVSEGTTAASTSRTTASGTADNGDASPSRQRDPHEEERKRYSRTFARKW
jgi:hypothetical protein